MTFLAVANRGGYLYYPTSGVDFSNVGIRPMTIRLIVLSVFALLYLGRDVVASLPLLPGVPAQSSWKVPAPAADGFIRVDIARVKPTRGQTSVSLLSNPVLIDIAPSRSWR